MPPAPPDDVPAAPGRRAGLLWSTRRSAVLVALLVLAGAALPQAFGPTASSGAPPAVASPSASPPPPPIAVTVGPAGDYRLTVVRTGWVFAGRVGAPLANLVTTTGGSGASAYQQTSFRYSLDGVSRTGAIRAYERRPAALFLDGHPTGGDDRAPFPVLNLPAPGLHRLAFHGAFAAAAFDPTGSAVDRHSPVVLFAGDARAAVVSAASDLLAAGVDDTGTTLTGALDPAITVIPSGLVHTTLLVAGTGIDATIAAWGSALMDLHHTPNRAIDAGAILRTLGYWTDNGSAYYYKDIAALGYPGTLLAVRDAMQRERIALGYVQLDSWWYPKGPQRRWQDGRDGIAVLDAAPDIFPNGLAAFHGELGLPLVVHARWIDSSSPYRQQYAMSGNVIVDPRYWADRAAFLRAAGVSVYEQDWLSGPATAQQDLVHPAQFLGAMAAAMRAQGLDIQYCLAGPQEILQTVLYPSVTTARVSPDRFEPARWDQFLYGSRLASAVGVWPWADTMRSTETLNLLLATLSGGPVGVGDAVDAIDATNLHRVVRADGVIVKPDAAVVPLDSVYLADAAGVAAPMVAATHVDHGGVRAAYVIAYARHGASRVRLDPIELGFTGSVYVVDALGGTAAQLLAPGQTTTRTVADGTEFVVVPVGPSGIALLGDTALFVGLGRQRVASLRDDGRLSATVAFAAGESEITLAGYARSRPHAQAAGGQILGVAWDPSSHRFTVRLAPGRSAQAVLQMSLG